MEAPDPEDSTRWGWQQWAVPLAIGGVILTWIVIDGGGDDPVVAEEPPACGAAAPPADAGERTCTASLAEGATVTVTYPATADPASPFSVRLCSDLEGELFATLGNNPSGAASHGSGEAGPGGCTQVDLEVLDTGTTTLLTAATGHDAVVVDNAIPVAGSGEETDA